MLYLLNNLQVDLRRRCLLIFRYLCCMHFSVKSLDTPRSKHNVLLTTFLLGSAPPPWNIHRAIGAHGLVKIRSNTSCYRYRPPNENLHISRDTFTIECYVCNVHYRLISQRDHLSNLPVATYPFVLCIFVWLA